MPESQRTTTLLPKEFAQPDVTINEAALHAHLNQDITAETFSALIASNFLMALDAYDRRLTRDYFEEVLITTFNFQNRLVRIAELNTMLEHLGTGDGFGTTEIKAEIDRHMDTATGHQAKLIATLRLFQEMRGKEDPVS